MARATESWDGHEGKKIPAIAATTVNGVRLLLLLLSLPFPWPVGPKLERAVHWRGGLKHLRLRAEKCYPPAYGAGCSPGEEREGE